MFSTDSLAKTKHGSIPADARRALSAAAGRFSFSFQLLSLHKVK
jgi:hypothetical protein